MIFIQFCRYYLTIQTEGKSKHNSYFNSAVRLHVSILYTDHQASYKHRMQKAKVRIVLYSYISIILYSNIQVSFQISLP